MMIEALNIVGAGSLGSFTAFLLSKESAILDCPMLVYDNDIVERHNLSNQLYEVGDIGQLKISALKKIIKSNNGFRINTINARVTDGSAFRGIPVVLVDSRESRLDIFRTCAYDAAIPYYIEARTGVNVAIVYAFNPRCKDWVERYEKTLLFDLPDNNRPCAGMEMVPVLWAVASAITKIVLDYRKKRVFRNEFLQIICDYEKWPVIKPTVVEEI